MLISRQFSADEVLKQVLYNDTRRIRTDRPAVDKSTVDRSMADKANNYEEPKL